MSFVQLGTLEVISMRLAMPLAGPWDAEVEVDADAIPLGASSIAIAVEDAPPMVFAGTVIESGGFEGRARAFLVGGSGGLRRELPPRQYSLAPPRLLVLDIIREAGEIVGDLSDLDGRAPLPRWVRSGGRGALALSVLCRRLGVRWRIDRDGRVRVLGDSWPRYAGEPFLVECDGATGWALAAHDAPDLEPGLVLEGKRIGRVVHRVAEGGVLRSEITFEVAS